MTRDLKKSPGNQTTTATTTVWLSCQAHGGSLMLQKEDEMGELRYVELQMSYNDK